MGIATILGILFGMWLISGQEAQNAEYLRKCEEAKRNGTPEPNITDYI